MLTPKENYLRVLHGEIPEWIPSYTQQPVPEGINATPSIMFEPSVLNPHRLHLSDRDLWGVKFIGCADADGAMMSDPNERILPDVTKWRDIIKAPDLSDVDWEMLAKKDLEKSGLDRRYTAVAFNTNFGMFQQLMAFMGFTDGLCALYEEPDECHELLDYVCDFYCGVIEKCIDYYKPDIFTMKDDTAGALNPFISLDMYKEFFLPLYDRQAKFARDRGLPITFHNCGTSMHFIEEVINIGVVSWDPAQTMNDLDSFKKKHGRSCAIAGGWIGREELLNDDVTDEQIYESVRTTIDHWAPGGGYIWCGSLLGGTFDPEIKRKNAVIRKAVAEIGANYYGI